MIQFNRDCLETKIEIIIGLIESGLHGCTYLFFKEFK